MVRVSYYIAILVVILVAFLSRSATKLFHYNIFSGFLSVYRFDYQMTEANSHVFSIDKDSAYKKQGPARLGATGPVCSHVLSSAFQFQSIMEGLAYDGAD